MPQDHSSPYIVGPPVDGKENFFGRALQIESFYAKLSRPQIAPLRVRGFRRSGKTSFLRHVADKAILPRHLDNLVVAYVDLLAGVREPADFYRVVVDAVCRAEPSARSMARPVWDFRDFCAFVTELYETRQPVVLLDELEVLAENSQFDLDFWRGLRSLVTPPGVVWVTASYRDVCELTRRPGHSEVSSAFYNVFDPEPIILGPLTEAEALDLITRPAASRNMQLTGSEAESIRGIAGGLPYSLQAVAEKWFLARRGGTPIEACFDKVLTELLDPRSLIPEVLASHWRHLTLAEQRVLELAASGKPIPRRPEFERARQLLLDFGLLGDEQGEPHPAGEMFRRWIATERKNRRATSVFVGHGHKQIWRTVRDFLEDQLGLQVIAYEGEARAGQTIVHILEDMLDQAEFAVLVLTAEDKMANGSRRPRQNVVHEVGYAQGRLGFQRVILLQQEGAEEISNIAGLQYVKFRGHDIEATFPALQAFFLT